MNLRELIEFNRLEYGLAYVVHRPSEADHVRNISHCHVCLTKGRPTKEHTPPKAAFNAEQRFWDTLAVRQYKISVRRLNIRGGHYARTLCVECNNIRCKPYADAYTAFTKDIINSPVILNARGDYVMNIRQNKLAIAKHLATMILAIEPIDFAVRESRLRRFALDEGAAIMPDFKVLAFLVRNCPQAGTIVRWHARVDLIYGKFGFAGGEISMYPFGFVYAKMIDIGYNPDQMTDITSWFTGGDTGPERFTVHVTGVGGIPDGTGFVRRRPQVDWVTN